MRARHRHPAGPKTPLLQDEPGVSTTRKDDDLRCDPQRTSNAHWPPANSLGCSPCTAELIDITAKLKDDLRDAERREMLLAETLAERDLDLAERSFEVLAFRPCAHPTADHANLAHLQVKQAADAGIKLMERLEDEQVNRIRLHHCREQLLHFPAEISAPQLTSRCAARALRQS